MAEKCCLVFIPAFVAAGGANAKELCGARPRVIAATAVKNSRKDGMLRMLGTFGTIQKMSGLADSYLICALCFGTIPGDK